MDSTTYTSEGTPASAEPTPTPLGGPEADDAARGLLVRLGRDTAYVIGGLPIAVLSFSVLVTGLALAAGLLVTVVGIPVAAGTLALAVGFGRLERLRLAARGTPLGPVHYAPRRGSGLRRMLNQLTDPRRWAAVLHGIGALVLSVATFSVVVTWWAGALGGLTYWFWERWLGNPESNTTLVELLDLPITEAQLNLLLGLLFALTLVPVTRVCAQAHVGWARLLLTGSSRAALAAQVDDLTTRRTVAAAAESHSLRRLERDIHDGPQQRLVRLGMDLSAAERRLTDDPEQARTMIAEARAQASEALAELRSLSRGIAPPILTDRGLAAALTAVVARSAVPTTVQVDLPPGTRPAPATESAAYYVATEALTNIAKHAGATSAAVTVSVVGAPQAAGPGDEGTDRVQVVVEDDGCGGAMLSKGHGLSGLADRVEGLGGRFSVHSPQGGPTRVVALLPWS
ncbi:sensor histidine kinase [Actinotalea sp. K2]|uniref:sensor histidine kinase n=1 Tax=Actinotalea sp. K2 TaxID=2939438 RepID=UPI002016ACF1|nr:sensor histidine kinase [Actinotalea sp. K2]MCL3860798.1 sensor domain-containing protein [Actinotalea sp. K2]